MSPLGMGGWTRSDAQTGPGASSMSKFIVDTGGEGTWREGRTGVGGILEGFQGQC